MRERYLITGGAGFIGSNVAAYYLARRKHVTVFDNCSRPGAAENLRWLRATGGNQLTFIDGDVSQYGPRLEEAVRGADVVLHLAAQVAVTTSVLDPVHDFKTNAIGTLNVLEAVRTCAPEVIVLYSSTNKVYGKMADLEVVETKGRYRYADHPDGISESRPLEFYSPYGCSKGAGDQYTLDYARIYGLRTVVFRQSCIYGPRQFGMEDQGWVAWFGIRAMQGLPVTVYGDGKQVRDVLYVDDLIAAYQGAIDNISVTAGQSYNIGGGPGNTLSLLELVEVLDEHFGGKLYYSFQDWRPGDQRIFVSDIRKAYADFGWTPRVNVQAGVSRLAHWLKENQRLFTDGKTSERSSDGKLAHGAFVGVE